MPEQSRREGPHGFRIQPESQRYRGLFFLTSLSRACEVAADRLLVLAAGLFVLLELQEAQLPAQLQVALPSPGIERRRPRRRPVTAQPGSCSWPQSGNRHRAARASISSKVLSSPSSSAQSPSSRMPGVSMSSAPPGSRTSSRAGRRMAAPPGRGVAHRRRPEALLAEQAVDHGRFSHSRGPEEGDRPSRREERHQAVEAPFGQGPDGHDRDPRRDARGRGDDVLEVRPEVGLVEDDDRARPRWTRRSSGSARSA